MKNKLTKEQKLHILEGIQSRIDKIAEDYRQEVIRNHTPRQYNKPRKGEK